MTTRTQDEIRARYEAGNDFFGFVGEVLAESMTADTIKQINPTADVSDVEPQTIEQVTEAARQYLQFAIEKISDHRGLSAERSVIKLREYAWLLGRDDVIAAMDAADYPQYGAPKVKAFADKMGWPFLDHVGVYERPSLARMADGDPCREDCTDGCGQ